MGRSSGKVTGINFIRAAKRTGYDKRISLRDLLYYFAATALKVMGDVTATMTTLGHSEARMTARYPHSTLARTTAAAGAAASEDFSPYTPPALKK